MDGIIDTVSAVHPIVPLINLLKPHGKIVMVGVPEKPLEFGTFPLIAGKHCISPFVFPLFVGLAFSGRTTCA